MRFFILAFLVTTSLFGDDAIQQQNIFILKFIVLLVVLLIVMPFVLKKVREHGPKYKKKELPPLEQFESIEEKLEARKEKLKPRYEKEIEVDPLEIELEALLMERSVPEADIPRLSPMYRRYLEVKTGRLELITASFTFSEVLDTVIQRLRKAEEDRNFEVVFDIAPDVPSQIIGDEVKLIELLFYIIQNVIIKSETYLIKLQIKRLNLGDDALHLEFYIPNGTNDYESQKLDIFTPFEGNNTETNLELYLAKSYANMLHGDVNFVQEDAHSSAFIVEVKLYMPNPDELRHYRLPSKTMIGHSVLVVDDHNESALAVKKMFEYFRNEVDLLSSKELFLAIEILDDYDIVVIQERFYAKLLNSKLLEIKKERPIKAVSLNKNDDFTHTNEETLALLDGQLTKPATVQKVYDLLVTLYTEKV